MRKVFLLAAPALVLFVASPAAALTKGQADCPVQLADAELSKALVSAMVDQVEGDEVDEGVLGGMLDVYTTCMKREKVPEAQADDYMTYVTEAIGVAELSRQLKSAGIKTSTVDQAFGIGPGGRNPEPEELTETDFARLGSLLASEGIKIESLPERHIGLIGAYAALAADLWKVREKLK